MVALNKTYSTLKRSNLPRFALSPHVNGLSGVSPDPSLLHFLDLPDEWRLFFILFTSHHVNDCRKVSLVCQNDSENQLPEENPRQLVPNL
jgi:hypothetical protein